MYYQGWNGYASDKSEAFKWFRKSADQGNFTAQYMLGLIYSTGSPPSVPKDLVQSYMWFNLAGSQGNPDAMKQRDDIAKLMKPDQLAKAQHLSNEWQPVKIDVPAAR